MTTQSINELIESKEWIMRDINRWHGQATIAMHRVDEYISSNMITLEMVEFFLSEPCGKTDKYAWETKKVDEVINLHIWKVQ